MPPVFHRNSLLLSCGHSFPPMLAWQICPSAGSVLPLPPRKCCWLVLVDMIRHDQYQEFHSLTQCISTLSCCCHLFKGLSTGIDFVVTPLCCKLLLRCGLNELESLAMRSGSVPYHLSRDVDSNVSIGMKIWLPVDSGHRMLHTLWCNVGLQAHIFNKVLLDFCGIFWF